MYTHTILRPVRLRFKKELKRCLNCQEELEKHIICEGARFHVIWWSNKGTHCSAPDCEINHKCTKEE